MIERRCLVCSCTIGPRAKTCSSTCRSILHRQRKSAHPPTDPVGREVWEMERRMMAEQAAEWLVRLAARIPERPTEAGRLRRQALMLAADLRQVFLLGILGVARAPRRPTIEEEDR